MGQHRSHIPVQVWCSFKYFCSESNKALLFSFLWQLRLKLLYSLLEIVVLSLCLNVLYNYQKNRCSFLYCGFICLKLSCHQKISFGSWQIRTIYSIKDNVTMLSRKYVLFKWQLLHSVCTRKTNVHKKCLYGMIKYSAIF